MENLLTCDWFWQEFCTATSPAGQWLATDTASIGSCCNLTKIVVKILIGLLECDTGSHWMTRVFSKSLEKSMFVITFHIKSFETKRLKNMRALNCQKSSNLKLEWSPWPQPDQNIKWGSCHVPSVSVLLTMHVGAVWPWRVSYIKKKSGQQVQNFVKGWMNVWHTDFHWT